MLLCGLANFSGPLLRKAEYYTDVEMNKEHEEVLLDLARNIFKCLNIELMSNLVMKQSKYLLDAGILL
jgi:hypothetical protein